VTKNYLNFKGDKIMNGRTEENRFTIHILTAALVIAILIAIVPGNAVAKSLYMAAEHHRRLFDAWNINPDGTATKQATYNLRYSTDPAGVAIDVDSETLFITSEFSGGVEMVDPVTLTYIGVSPGPSNLAGIDVDDADNIVYSVRRWSDDLYIFDWDQVSKTITLLARIDLPNCIGAFGIALDETRDILWVADTAAGVVRAYNVAVSTWSDITEITDMNFRPSHKPVDVAVDRKRNIVYTVSIIGGAAVPGGTGSPFLSKYDVGTGMETIVHMGHAGVGVAVDEINGFVYVTGGAYAGDNLTVWDTSTTPFTKIQDTGRIGNPAGLAIGNVSYNPLRLAKNDIIQGEGVSIGSNFTYQMNYDNSFNPTLDVHNVTILDNLPAEVDFVSATEGGLYDPDTHTVLWDIGTIPAGATGPTIDLVVKVNQNAILGSTIHNYCTIEGDEIPPTTVIDQDPEDPDDEPGTPIIEPTTKNMDCFNTNMIYSYIKEGQRAYIKGYGSFLLAEDAGYDLDKDDVTFEIDSSIVTIPAGSFNLMNQWGQTQYMYYGKLSDGTSVYTLLKFTTSKNKWELVINRNKDKSAAEDINEIDNSNGVDVSLTIGNNIGTENITINGNATVNYQQLYYNNKAMCTP
jgi:sugar lactone lactonase YvrE